MISLRFVKSPYYSFDHYAITSTRKQTYDEKLPIIPNELLFVHPNINHIFKMFKKGVLTWKIGYYHSGIGYIGISNKCNSEYCMWEPAEAEIRVSGIDYNIPYGSFISVRKPGQVLFIECDVLNNTIKFGTPIKKGSIVSGNYGRTLNYNFQNSKCNYLVLVSDQKDDRAVILGLNDIHNAYKY